MKIGIYYGGRGIISDPTLYVLKKMTEVFEELNVNVERYDLYDQKNTITTLPQTLKDLDGIILASTVEWHGAGGYIHSFLDAIWLYGDKERIQKIYMAPVIMSTTYGEKDAELDMIKAWVTLGGMCAEGLTGYVPDVAAFETNEEYIRLIEKCAENIYRAISQKKLALPISTREVSRKVNKTPAAFLTQQETEQLSEYISDEKYVSKQKEDIKELADIFKGMLGSSESGADTTDKTISLLRSHFVPKPETHIRYLFVLNDLGKKIVIDIDNAKCEIKEGDAAYPDSTLTMSGNIMDEIVAGRKTFQGGFMDGSIVAKGDFKNMRLLDEMFVFE